MRVKEAADWLGVSRSVVYRLIEQGHLDAEKDGRGWQIGERSLPTARMRLELERARRSSPHEQDYLAQVRAARLPEPEREYAFHEDRRWRFDFAWPQAMVAVEIEGAVWSRGRHTRGSGFLRDAEKYNEAALLGWTVLRFPPTFVKDGTALDMTERLLRKLVVKLA